MSTFNWKPSRKIFFIALMAFSFTACNNNSSGDALIQKKVAALIDSGKNYTGTEAKVDNGVVTLTGTCNGDGCVADVEKNVAKIEGVKQVVNNLSMSATDLTLRTSVQSIVTKYTGVQADVAAGEVVLRGTISRDLLEPLMTELKALNAKKIDNQLAIKQ